MSAEGPRRTGKFLAVDWNTIEELCIELAEVIASSGKEIDAIVGILRGGWIPARLLSDYLGVQEMGAIEIKFYKGVGETYEHPVVTQPLVTDVKGKSILLVDDVADTGKTLKTAVSLLKLYGPRSIITATIFVKPWSSVKPDFYVRETDAWIIFPWDKAETYVQLMSRGYSLERVAEVCKDDPRKVERLLRTRAAAARASRRP